MKAEAILADMDNLWNRVCLLEKALTKLNNNARTKADEIFEKIIKEYGKRNSQRVLFRISVLKSVMDGQMNATTINIYPKMETSLRVIWN